MKLTRFLPQKMRQTVERRQETNALSKLPIAAIDARSLRADVPQFDKPELVAEWQSVTAVMRSVGLENPSGGVNIGDRRAIYQIARATNPRAILECGTHVGASTLMLALAVKNTGAEFTTVDIADVNGPRGAWARTGCRQPPAATLELAGCTARFVTMPSVDYLERCKAKFDLIFLDDLHTAENVYRQIPLALRLLNPGGTILMHDVFPNLEPLWPDGAVVPGPWLAMERYRREGAPLKVSPLGKLGWPTKQGSSVTSLAALLRN